ncbi:hypothetical protein AURDEDRAFT_130652 [Auricularia subglabra TFB-10046 SS5]|uniref:Polysaccharide lyase 14 domain-containing protein n=1 Tax=Auricularia subglabra (strain TFB-10046 / SS5) TaxID=717982 RepID=J0WT30_AURST|nr:hypothetical protein AURDEDRAFT_130652 [Auricularia subglabra TFB-10046 SS5]
MLMRTLYALLATLPLSLAQRNPTYLFPIDIVHGFTTVPGNQTIGTVSPNALIRTPLTDKGIGVLKRAGGLPSPVIHSPDGTLAYQATYPKGSYKPSGDIVGGFGFYFSGPSGFSFENADEILFSYSVYFPADFPWVMGGKLPGPFGGANQDIAEGCSGGRQDGRNKCFSLRLMWRADGDGEIYAYLPELPENDSPMNLTGSVKDPTYGLSIARGTFKFAAGQWTVVAQRVRMNQLGAKDGELELWVNGESVIHATGLSIRVDNATTFRGIHAQTFFGGSTAQWATPIDAHAWFADFSGAVVQRGSSPADGKAPYPLAVVNNTNTTAPAVPDRPDHQNSHCTRGYTPSRVLALILSALLLHALST